LLAGLMRPMGGVVMVGRGGLIFHIHGFDSILIAIIGTCDYRHSTLHETIGDYRHTAVKSDFRHSAQICRYRDRALTCKRARSHVTIRHSAPPRDKGTMHSNVTIG
jgi:hypothetical protein